jgi:hypothetical protein
LPALVALAVTSDEAKVAFGAMIGMKKIDVAAIEFARRGCHCLANFGGNVSSYRLLQPSNWSHSPWVASISPT